MLDDDHAMTLVIKKSLLERIDNELANSPFKTRLEFIRYLLDMSLSEMERINA